MLSSDIYNNLGRGVKSVQEYDAEAQANQANKLALMMKQAQYDEYGRKVADDNALRQVVGGFGQDDNANVQSLFRAGRLPEAQAYRKSIADNAEAQAKAGHLTAQTTGLGLDQKIQAHNFHLQQLGALTDPSQIDAWATQGVKDGVMGMQESMRGAEMMKQYAAQNGFEAAKQQAMKGGMSALEQLKLQQQQEVARETNRHNVSTEGLTATGQVETGRHNRASEGVAYGNLAETKRRHSAEEGAGVGLEGFSPAAIENAAARYNVDGTLPPMGMGKAGSQGRQAILNRAAELSVGTSGTDQRIAQMDSKAAGTALNQLTKSKTMNAAFEKTANANAELALGLSDKLPRTGMPLLNGAIQAVRKGTGSPEATQFAAANETFVAEYAKIMSGGMGNGPVSDAARKKASDLLTTAMTADQYKGNVKLLQTEMGNRMKGFDDEEKALRGRLGGKKDEAPAATAPKIVQFGDLK